MNFPILHEWKESFWFPKNDYRFITHLLQIVSETILGIFPTDGTAMEDCIGHPLIQGTKFDDIFPPVLLLLLNIARQDEIGRNMIRKVIMPNDMYYNI